MDGPIPKARPDLGECLLWTGGKNGDAGYGVFRLGSQKDGTRRQVLAHRFAFTLWHGREPEGVLDHLCLVRNCINVWHLEDVTQRENTLRGTGMSARHAVKVACPECNGPYSFSTRGARYCKPCMRIARQAWANRNREKVNAYQRAYKIRKQQKETPWTG